MANQRNVETYYGNNTRSLQHANKHEGRGRAVSILGAVLAATKRVTSGEYARADIYDNAGHACTITRHNTEVKIYYYYGHRFGR